MISDCDMPMVPDCKAVRPHNFGWLEKKLSEQEVNHLWKCVNNRGISVKKNLAGNIHDSNALIDEDEWFFTNTITPLCYQYADEFNNLADTAPVNQRHPFHLQSLWVNYQKQNEFNPLHNHTGVYSFVVWMKIPTRHFEQNKNSIALLSNSPKISTFQFNYTNILGKIEEYTYEMNPEMEGTMLFFPASLVHGVHPFYNCEEDRISISGNVALDTTRTI